MSKNNETVIKATSVPKLRWRSRGDDHASLHAVDLDPMGTVVRDDEVASIHRSYSRRRGGDMGWLVFLKGTLVARVECQRKPWISGYDQAKEVARALYLYTNIITNTRS